MTTKIGPETPAEAAGPGFARVLTWRDGFAISLVIPVVILAILGPSIGVIGTWGVVALLGIGCVVALLQNFLFAEMASMFPKTPGGIALYAHEGWKGYFAPIGAVAAFGYWAGWAFGNAVFALTAGQLIQAQFFSDVGWTISTGSADIGLSHLIAVACLISVWVLNTLGIRPAVQLNKLLGIFAVGLIALLAIGPMLTGDLDFSRLTWGLGAEGQAWGGWQLAIVFLFVFGWTAYGTEVAATFAPEYRDPNRDTSLALRCAGLFALAVALLLPVGLGGTVGDVAIAADPGAVYASAFAVIVGPAAGLVTILVCASLYLVMNSATADAGRALYGIARADMTIKQLNHLNSRHVPARAMFCDVVINILMLLFVGNVLGIIFSSNIGYIAAVVFALTGFILLRRDRPRWPRPVRLASGWVVVAAVLALYNSVLLVVGFLNPAEAGYGGLKEQLIGIGILSLAVVLFAYRRVVQDRGSLRLREEVAERALASEVSPSLPAADG